MNSATINEQHQAIWTETTDAIYHMISSDVMLVFAAIVGLYLIILGIGFIQDFLGFASARSENASQERKDELLRQCEFDDDLDEESEQYSELDTAINVATLKGDSGRVAIYKHKQKSVVRSASNRLKFHSNRKLIKAGE